MFKKITVIILFGVGAGMKLKLKNGIFEFAYGLGQFKRQVINPNLSRIHFGVKSKF